MFSFIAGRLLGKFLLWLIPSFLAVSAAGIYIAAEYDLRQETDAIIARVGNHAGRVAATLARHDPRADAALGADLMSSLLADRAVRCAGFRVETVAVVAIPRGLPCEGGAAGQQLEVPIDDLEGAHLVIQLDFTELSDAWTTRRDLAMIALAFGLLIAIVASFLAFRQTVINPLRRLLDAISRSARTGEMTVVENRARDELGVVIDSYNDLQGKLRSEAASLRASLEHIETLYNGTPAPMFCIDAEGRFTEASDYWLSFTGYAKSEVIGGPVAAFIRPTKTRYDPLHVIKSIAAADEICDNEVLVRQKSGSEIDALLSATKRDAAGGYICVLTDISFLRSTERELQRAAVTDRLTRLPNRAALVDETHAIIEALVPGEQLTALYIDLDNFKQVNDTFGHQAGDRLLVEVTRRMKDAAGASAKLFRLGGDEFAIFMSDTQEERRARVIARKIIDAISRPVDIDDGVGFVSCSIGMSFLEPEQASSAEGLRRADLAMYLAKQEGKNCFRVYSNELGEQADARAARATMIRQAFDSGWYALYFQPIVRLSDRRPIAAEALLRVLDGSEPPVSTQAIIQTAEETGQMERLGGWVIAAALGHTETMAKITAPESYLSLNLSAQQLNGKLLANLRQHLARTGFPPQRLVIEITETALIGKFDEAIDILAAIRHLGVRVALDDFGTGYSSLSYFRRLPVDIIKLDRSLTAGIGTTALCPGETDKASALIRSVASLAREMGIAVVAEGIETELAAAELARLGVDYGQGYHFSRPLPQIAFNEWIERFDPGARRAVTPLHMSRA